MEKYLISFVFLSVGISYVISTSPPAPNGEILYSALRDLRDKLFDVPNFKKIPMLEANIEQEAWSLKQLMGLDVHDDNSLKQFAFKIADAITLNEIAEIINVPPRELRHVDEHIAYAIRMMDMVAKELKVYHKWVRKSGFADTWPLDVSYYKTKKMLDKCSISCSSFIAFKNHWKFSSKELAKILTDSELSSVDEYFIAVDLPELNTETDVEKQRKSFLQVQRVFATKDGMNDFANVVRSAKNCVETIDELGISKLPIELSEY